MSVGSPLYTLLKSNLRAWIGAKGFWLVAAAALLPLVLTGAWVAAHQADVEVSDLRIEGAPFMEGQTARFSATVSNVGKESVGAFNFTLAVGEVEGNQLFVSEDQSLTIENLAPGETREITLEWNATPGVLYVLATADPEDALGEKDEFNNQEAEPIAVGRNAPTTMPTAPATLAGDANATSEVDLQVTTLTRPTDIKPGDNATFAVEVANKGTTAVENANVTLRVQRFVTGRYVPVQTTTQNVTLGPGETTTIQLAWTTLEGAFAQEAYAVPPAAARELTPEDNHKAEAFVVNAVVTDDMRPPEPDERLTIKEFYLSVLSLLHLRILLPLIALFYAAGVIADERERGSLPYMLTRPIPRWLIPLTKFVASFVVAAIASVIGLALTYLFLFGTTAQGGDIGFLTTPLLASLLTLFVYGAVFILLGVLVERPYLVGILIVLGWENVANLLVPFVRNFTLTTHIGNALAGWRLDSGLQWVPEGDAAMRAFWILLGVGVAALVGASVQMRRREFQV